MTLDPSMVAFLGFTAGVVAMGAAMTANSIRVTARQEKRHKQELLRLRSLRQETEADLDVQRGRAARADAVITEAVRMIKVDLKDSIRLADRVRLIAVLRPAPRPSP